MEKVNLYRKRILLTSSRHFSLHESFLQTNDIHFQFLILLFQIGSSRLDERLTSLTNNWVNDYDEMHISTCSNLGLMMERRLVICFLFPASWGKWREAMTSSVNKTKWTVDNWKWRDGITIVNKGKINKCRRLRKSRRTNPMETVQKLESQFSGF